MDARSPITLSTQHTQGIHKQNVDNSYFLGRAFNFPAEAFSFGKRRLGCGRLPEVHLRNNAAGPDHRHENLPAGRDMALYRAFSESKKAYRQKNRQGTAGSGLPLSENKPEKDPGL